MPLYMGEQIKRNRGTLDIGYGLKVRDIYVQYMQVLRPESQY